VPGVPVDLLLIARWTMVAIALRGFLGFGVPVVV
jgi:hypothetical protein